MNNSKPLSSNDSNNNDSKDDQKFEDYFEHIERCRQKRRSNERTSAQVLTDHNIRFESKNDAMHLIVYGKNHTVDFWPSRGIFIVRKSNVQGRGVFNLIDFLNKEQPESLLDALFS